MPSKKGDTFILKLIRNKGVIRLERTHEGGGGSRKSVRHTYKGRGG